ncbi:MAG: anti-sigma factor [Actinomycetota bacterium]
MTDRYSCEEVRELAGELALGIAPAKERARALEHLVSCAQCRDHVQGLSAVADEILLLAPDSEPPVGFESRVIEAFDGRTPRRHRFQRMVLAAAALVLAAAVAAGGTYLAGSHSRALADRWANALGTGNGSSFSASALSGTRSGVEAGHAFLFRGKPSWVYVEVEAPSSFSGTYGVQLVTSNGDTVPVGSVTYTDGQGSWGRSVDRNGATITGLQCTEEDGSVVLTANFPVNE